MTKKSEFQTEPVHSVLVIGAGPGGLSIADQLQRNGLRVPVLERAEGAGDSWRRMPEAMRMNSPAGVNVLGDTRVGFLGWDRIWNRGQFYRHLLDFADQKNLDIRYGQEVIGIDRNTAGILEVRTTSSLYRAHHVVNATGYFGEPVIPERPGDSLTKIPRVTVPEYQNPEALERRMIGETRRVLIVGGRITAGQLAVELHESGYPVTISHRNPIQFGFPPSIQRLGFRLYYPYEAYRLHSPDFAKRDSGHPMQGGAAKDLIQAGHIETRPDIEAFEELQVRFVDGQKETFGAVLWATGYRPVLGHLGLDLAMDPETGLPELDEMESVTVPGLHFLGLDQQVDYTSRMLRGIRRDAIWLANRLRDRESSRRNRSGGAKPEGDPHE